MSGKSDDEQLAEDRESQLRQFFPPECVGWEITGQGLNILNLKAGDVVNVVPKLTPLAIVQRLDDVLGVSGWAEEFATDANACRCILRVRLTLQSDWVTRFGLAPLMSGAAVQAAHAEASRVAAARLGIGRYLVHYGRAVKWRQEGGYDAPRLPDEVLPDQYRRAGRERAATLRGLFNACVEESGKLSRPVNPEEAARRLVAKHGYRPDSQGNVNFAECEVRHVRLMTEQCNEWLAQLAARNTTAPANPMLCAPEVKKDENKSAQAPGQKTQAAQGKTAGAPQAAKNNPQDSGPRG